MSYSVPHLVRDQETKYSIVFDVAGRRYRISNGKKLGVALNPNGVPGCMHLTASNHMP